MIKFPRTESDFFALQGGLDLVTPAIAMPPGRVIDAQNYEPAVSGGYRRIDGYERFDGQPSPTASADYQLLPVIELTNVPLLSGINGGTSGVGGRLLAKLPNPSGVGLLYVLDRTTGTYRSNENIYINSLTTLVGQTNGAMTQAATASDAGDYILLAANDFRNDIGQVPGSGPVRGVAALNDVVYAFRDNANGTAGAIYQSSPTGWVQVAMGYELQYANGTTQINVGDTVTNGTATGVVTGVTLKTGAWSGTATGSLFFTALTGSFAANDPIKVGTTQKATAAAASAQISRAPGGRLEIVKYNFAGSPATLALYGADGVNTAFQFDGTNYWPIRTGMTIDAPSHVTCHEYCLFLSFFGSVQFSAPGQPFAWTAVLGAAEIATGDDVSGMLPLGGNQTGSALALFTRERMHVLFGSSSGNFQMQTSVTDIGFAPYTVQPISNTTYGITARGIQSLDTTQAFGDFQSATLSQYVQPLMNRMRGQEIASTTLHASNQYRLYYDDGSVLVMGFTGENVTGIMPLNYGKPVRCIWTSTWSAGQERTFFGSDDGYVYEEGVGTSFDGNPIEAWLRLAFHHQNAPRVRKRFRRAVLEASVESFAAINMSYDVGYGNPDVPPPPALADTPLIGSPGGYWDQFIWDQFNWDAQAVLSPSISLEGTEKNLSLIFYSNRAQDESHTLQGVTLIYTMRRLER